MVDAGSDARAAARRARAVPWLSLALTACVAGGYAPCPVELRTGLPADAFARCRSVLLQRYGAIAVVDEASFLLQTPWVPVEDPIGGERRASVFRDRAVVGTALAVVVELRRVTVPPFGLPEWSTPRGDDAAERELAAALQQELAAAP